MYDIPINQVYLQYSESKNRRLFYVENLIVQVNGMLLKNFFKKKKVLSSFLNVQWITIGANS